MCQEKLGAQIVELEDNARQIRQQKSDKDKILAQNRRNLAQLLERYS